MNLPSVIVSLVLFAICLPTMLHGYSRATATIWNAKAEQHAVAVASWHAAIVSEDGCGSYSPPKVVAGLLLGEDLTPPNGDFTVSCDTTDITWPPEVTSKSPTGAESGAVASLTTKWSKLNGTARSVSLTVLETP